MAKGHFDRPVVMSKKPQIGAFSLVSLITFNDGNLIIAFLNRGRLWFWLCFWFSFWLWTWLWSRFRLRLRLVLNLATLLSGDGWLVTRGRLRTSFTAWHVLGVTRHFQGLGLGYVLALVARWDVEWEQVLRSLQGVA